MQPISANRNISVIRFVHTSSLWPVWSHSPDTSTSATGSNLILLISYLRFKAYLKKGIIKYCNYYETTRLFESFIVHMISWSTVQQSGSQVQFPSTGARQYTFWFASPYGFEAHRHSVA